MINSPSISKEDEEYIYKLVIASPDEDVLLPIIQEGLWYQMLLVSENNTADAGRERIASQQRAC